MKRPVIEPITDASLPEFAAFLHAHLNSAFSPETWEAAFRTQWMADPPNYGFLLRDQGQVVGGIGAFYAERPVNGETERFCNITSWCVLDAYRQQSMRLAVTMISQEGFHFTDFSPTKVVAGTLQFLKFKPLDDRQAVIFNVPGWPAGSRVIDRADELRAALSGGTLATYLDHAQFPWLKHLAIGQGSEWCYLIYKHEVFKGLPAARIIHFSDPSLFERYLGGLRNYLLLKGYATTHVECRRLNRQPWFSKIRSGFNPKVFLSPSLAEQDIDYLYSESITLDV
jgi:hypothetical protein